MKMIRHKLIKKKKRIVKNLKLLDLSLARKW